MNYHAIVVVKIYGELEALLAGLMEYEHHIDIFNDNVIIYSDIDHINHIFNYQVTLKMTMLTTFLTTFNWHYMKSDETEYQKTLILQDYDTV
ncbi:hypothetical protein SporoP8_01820 [Sporosarcina ureae]|nr:hypothetical protein SporoP8_01820 [Sporosarcina ureae]